MGRLTDSLRGDVPAKEERSATARAAIVTAMLLRLRRLQLDVETSSLGTENGHLFRHDKMYSPAVVKCKWCPIA